MISIVIPAHNEEGYLEPAVKSVIAGVRDRDQNFEIIIAENGSADATAAEAERLAKIHPEVSVINLPHADYGKALRAGFLQAKGDIVVNFDVDLVDIHFLERAIELLARPDLMIVVGSKRSPGAADNRSPLRQAVTAVFSFVLRHGFGLKVSDTHGLKALRRAPLTPLAESCKFGADIFDTELILRAERAGLGVSEIPVTVTDLRPPRTPIATRIPRSLLGLARLRLALSREPR